MRYKTQKQLETLLVEIQYLRDNNLAFEKAKENEIFVCVEDSCGVDFNGRGCAFVKDQIYDKKGMSLGLIAQNRCDDCDFSIEYVKKHLKSLEEMDSRESNW